MRRVAIFIVLVFASCRTAPVTEQNPYANHAGAALAGAKLFRQHCAACHGADAAGRGNAPSLQTPSVEERSDAALFAFITNGDLRYGMPSWSRLPEQRRWQIVSYLRSLAPAGSARGDSERELPRATAQPSTRTHSPRVQNDPRLRSR